MKDQPFVQVVLPRWMWRLCLSMVLVALSAIFVMISHVRPSMFEEHISWNSVGDAVLVMAWGWAFVSVVLAFGHGTPCKPSGPWKVTHQLPRKITRVVGEIVGETVQGLMRWWKMDWGDRIAIGIFVGMHVAVFGYMILFWEKP